VNIGETTHGFADKVYDRAQLSAVAGAFLRELASCAPGRPSRRRGSPATGFASRSSGAGWRSTGAGYRSIRPPGRSGKDRSRTPDAAKIAFAIAGATAPIGVSPAPAGGSSGRSIRITSIGGTSMNRGTG
jgi:hypothetical protein